MKLTLVLNLLCTIAFSANSFSQNNISVNLENAKVKDVFHTIEGQSTYRFFYNDELTDINRLVNLEVKNSKIEDVLKQLFSNTEITYTILENNLIVIAPKRAVQQIKVTGTVTDNSTGESMPGVNLVVEGTSMGVISDANGKFSITVPSENAVLIFSFIGYLSEKISVAGQTNIDIKLSPDIKNLEEIVVIGYGTQRKEAVTGSVASVSGDVVREVASANITQALQGRISGVDMEQTSSQPGAAMQIRIRGTRSLNATNDPLVVLDGIPFAGSIGEIDPNSIKSIDILKDASATAIYGSRGANGVILVTTIKGKKGQLQVNYSGYYGVKQIFHDYPMMTGPKFVRLRADANLYHNAAGEADTINTNWQKLLYKPGAVTNHDLSVSGGSEKGAYSFGMSYFRDEANIPLQNYTRYSLRATVDQELGKLFKFGMSSLTNYNIMNGANLGAGSALGLTPITSPYNNDGTPKQTVTEQSSGAVWSYTKQNLEALGDKYIDQTKGFGTHNALYGELKIPGIEGLKYRANLGLDYNQNNYGNYTGANVFSGTASVSSATVRNEHTFHWVFENLLTFDRTFGDHKINVVAMYSTEQRLYYKSEVTAKNIPADFLQFYNMGQVASDQITINPNNQSYQLSGLQSYMGRIMYSYKDRYMLSATLRSDGSSVLSTGHKWFNYPAVSLGWNLKEESFMKSIALIDLLKFRVGYGVTSNQAINPYQTLGTLTTRPYNFGATTYLMGTYMTQIPNPALGWEFSKTWNVGMDFSLLKNRISGTIEAYTMSTDNVLLNVSLPASSGVGSVMANMGKTENKGVEITLNDNILSNVNGWTWDVGFNLAVNRGKIVSLASGATQDINNNWFVGHSMNVIYDYKRLGLWQQDDQYQNILEPGGNVGMIKIKYNGEYNPDGSPVRAIGVNDREVMNLDPNYEGGFNTRIAYKGIDFILVGYYQNGGLLNSTLYGASGYLNQLNARAGNNVNVAYWTPDNTGAKYPKPGGMQSGDNPKYGSTLGYFSATYMKVRSMTLGYSFSQKWIKKVGVSNLRIYATVQNPFVLFSPYTKETGMDPETNSYGDQNVAVAGAHKQLIIGANTPSTRNYLFGINLSF